MKIVGLLHPGQMGTALGLQAKDRGIRILWCPAGRSESTCDRAAAAGFTAIADLPELVDRSELLVAVCPPAAAEDVATEVADLGFDGLYLDANAISPARMARIDERLSKNGCRVVDGSIFGLPPRDHRTAQLCLAGEPADVQAIANLFDGTLVVPAPLNRPCGAASALKMAYSGYQKTARILAAISLAVAADFDLTEELIDQASKSKRSPLADPDYLPIVASKGWRWGPELQEFADTLDDKALPSDLARAASKVVSVWNEDKDAWDLSVGEVLDHLHQR